MRKEDLRLGQSYSVQLTGILTQVSSVSAMLELTMTTTDHMKRVLGAGREYWLPIEALQAVEPQP